MKALLLILTIVASLIALGKLFWFPWGILLRLGAQSSMGGM